MKFRQSVVLTCLVTYSATNLLDVSCTAKTASSKTVQAKAIVSDAAKGKALFRANGCFDCHSINGQGCTEGVSLSSVGLRRDVSFLKEQLVDPEEHAEKNKKAFNSEPNLMTNPNLSKREISLIVSYLRTLRKPVPKKGERSHLSI